MKIFYLALFLLFPSLAYSQSPCPGLDSINYSGQWYHTVQIGSQCWLKENLNIGSMMTAISNQKDNDTIEKYCYNNDPNMCEIYGGLYQWREAVQYSIKRGTRGICPLGWHIPSYLDFRILDTTVHGDGNALKKIGEGQGTNISGFSGLLSGLGSYSTFIQLGTNANFWNSYSFYLLNQDPYEGVYLGLWNDSDVILGEYYNTDFALSVRCLKDTAGLLLQSPFGGENWQIGSLHMISWGGILENKKIKIEYTTDNGNSWILILDSAPANDGEYKWTIPNTPSAKCMIKLTDLSDLTSISISDSIFTIHKDPCPEISTIEHGNKVYRTVDINGKCWFQENLNIGIMIPGNKTPATNGIIEKYCYNNDTTYCTKYGGLYTYPEMQEPGICPTFWHIASYDEFNYLMQKVSFDGNALKKEGEGTEFGIGYNSNGFSALLGGCRNYDSTFAALGASTIFPYNYFMEPILIDLYFIDGNTSATSFSDEYKVGVAGGSRCVRDDIGPLLLKSPSGGENWLIGSTQKITWSFSSVINIRIDYSTNNGTNWINIISSTPTSAGSLNWTIPNTPSTNCKVKISSTNSSDTNSIGNLFSIYQIPINPCPGIPTVNYAGQTYNTVAIGDQCWMRENLNIGTMIDSTQNQTNNEIIEKYCYNNDLVKCSLFGGLYQWDEAMQYVTTENTKGICPTGWHIPSWNDFATVKSFVSGNGNNLKEIGQGSGSGAGTNASGFSALLAGINFNGTFNNLGTSTIYWRSTNYDATHAYKFQLTSIDTNIIGNPVFKSGGYSIRCINDSTVSALPVELTKFTTSVINNNVILNWNTATELNTLSFDIEMKLQISNSWYKIASVSASGNSNSP
ncbi:MAG: FISUMP domain-containing protein, partial [Ignavibacteriaceae bacterium]|nr:FISUMP domain-containing protein [Ignavibacteriaceae bacterium]